MDCHWPGQSLGVGGPVIVMISVSSSVVPSALLFSCSFIVFLFFCLFFQTVWILSPHPVCFHHCHQSAESVCQILNFLQVPHFGPCLSFCLDSEPFHSILQPIALLAFLCLVFCFSSNKCHVDKDRANDNLERFLQQLPPLQFPPGAQLMLCVIFSAKAM